MLIIPAIDIKSNNIVRLIKGDFKKLTIFSKNPLNVILKLVNLNCKRIHLIDLDGALKGFPKNLFIIKLIINFIIKIKLQIGGGIRSLEILKYYLDLGVSYIIIGTKFFNDIKFLKHLSNKYPYNIILSLDLKDNDILLNGWKNKNKINLKNFLLKIKNFKINSIIYTDTLKDGLGLGLNLNFAKKIIKFSKNFKLILSGGLKNTYDYKLCFNNQKSNIIGFICGKSIYTNNFNYNNILKYNNIYNNYYLKKDYE